MTLTNSILARWQHVKSLGSDGALREAVRKIPKHELHVHLAGSIRRATALELAQRYGVALPCAAADFLSAPAPLLCFSGDDIWSRFHATYLWHWSCVQRVEDLQRVLQEALEDAAAQGVVYSEYTISGSYVLANFSWDEWTSALAETIDAAQHSFGICGRVILDISRRRGPALALETVQQIASDRPRAICGIGLGGDEVRYPHRLFHAAFACARAEKIFSTVHVSEFTDGATTTEALDTLQPDRLGHALTTHRDTAAYAHLRSSGRHVESCPACNVIMGVDGIEHFADHPIRKYFDAGIPLGINTDDPQILGIDLLDVYVALARTLDFSLEDFAAMNAQAQRVRFCSV